MTFHGATYPIATAARADKLLGADGFDVLALAGKFSKSCIVSYIDLCSTSPKARDSANTACRAIELVSLLHHFASGL